MSPGGVFPQPIQSEDQQWLRGDVTSSSLPALIISPHPHLFHLVPLQTLLVTIKREVCSKSEENPSVQASNQDSTSKLYQMVPDLCQTVGLWAAAGLSDGGLELIQVKDPVAFLIVFAS